MAETRELLWYCWIHNSPEQCAEDVWARSEGCEPEPCSFGYWLCPECNRGMEYIGEGEEGAYAGPWYCGDCECTVDTRAAVSRGSTEEREA